MNSPAGYHIVRLSDKRKISDDCSTLLFNKGILVAPGQFIMIWIPGVDEIPMSVSHSGENSSGITVKMVGNATKILGSMNIGARLRIRGPYGRGFTPRGKNALLIAGGVGAASLTLLSRQLVSDNCRVVAIIGAKKKDELVLVDDFQDSGAETRIATDDGSAGFKGTASALFSETIQKEDFDSIYCCGPEAMIRSVAEEAFKLQNWGQAAMERLMRCGIGICGSCAIGKELVCKNGPVFDFEQLMH